MRYQDSTLDFTLRTADGKAMGEGRTPNSIAPDGSLTVHLSSILRFMERSLEDKPRDESAFDNPLWAAFGFVFEKAMAEYYSQQREVRLEQSERTVDGIIMTGDALSLEDGAYEEYKVRWRSARKFLDAENWERWFWKELLQVKANCYGYGTMRARLIVFFVCGDWKPPAPWPPICRELEFSEQELRSTWSVLQGNRLAMERLLRSGELQLSEL